MNMLQCKTCETKTPHEHQHREAHGIRGTHMAGSEVHICAVCGTRITASDGRDDVPFIYDKKEEVRWVG